MIISYFMGVSGQKIEIFCVKYLLRMIITVKGIILNIAIIYYICIICRWKEISLSVTRRLTT